MSSQQGGTAAPCGSWHKQGFPAHEASMLCPGRGLEGSSDTGVMWDSPALLGQANGGL